MALGAIDPFKVGVTQADIPAQIWKNADVALLGEGFQRLAATPSRSVSVLTLQRTLLTASVEGPTGKVTDELSLRRLRAIFAAGGVANVRAMLPRIPGHDAPGFQVLAADAALLAGRTEDACEIEQGLKADKALPVWVRLRALCQVKAKDPAADLTLTLVRTSGVRDEGYLAALSTLQGGAPPKALTIRSALDLALARGLTDWSGVDVQKASLPTLAALAVAKDVPADKRLGPAWRAVGAGLLDGAALRDVLMAQAGPDAPVIADLEAAKKLNGPFAIARLARIALTSPERSTAVQAAFLALKLARSHAELVTLSGALKPVLSALKPEEVGLGERGFLAMACVLVGESGVADKLVEGVDLPAQQAFLLALVRDNGPATGAAFERWLMEAMKGDSAARAQATGFYPLLAAVGAPLTAGTRKAALDLETAPKGVRPPSGVEAAMWAALTRKSYGEVGVWALVALGEGGPTTMDRGSLSGVLSALTASGLGFAARDMVREVVLSDMLTPPKVAVAKPAVKATTTPPKKS